MQIVKILALLSLLFFTQGCSLKAPLIEESPKSILIKTESRAMHNSGFVREYRDRVEVLIYSVGSGLFRMSIYEDVVCIDRKCTKNESFYESFFKTKYPKNLLKSVVLGREIYDGIYLKKDGDKRIQRIKNGELDILYEVDKKRIYFRDFRAGVRIIIEDLEEI